MLRQSLEQLLASERRDPSHLECTCARCQKTHSNWSTAVRLGKELPPVLYFSFNQIDADDQLDSLVGTFVLA